MNWDTFSADSIADMAAMDNIFLVAAVGHRNSWERRKVHNAFGEQVASTMDLEDRSDIGISTSHLLKVEEF